MKYYFLFFTMMIATNLFSQNNNAMDKPFSGRFQGSSSGIFIYDDGTFLLFGYATLVLGKYEIKDQTIFFTPDIDKQPFTVLGRNNTLLKNETSLTFGGSFFRSGPTYIKLDDQPVQPIFTETNGSISPTYKTTISPGPKSIKLLQNSYGSYYTNNTSTFELPAEFNDYLVLYNRTISEQKPFYGVVEQKEGKSYLNCDWGTFQKVVGEGDEEWETFVTNFRKNVLQTENETDFYFNDQLKSAKGFNQLSEEFSIFDISQYTLDQASNKYILSGDYTKGNDYSNALVTDYHDESIILKYKEIAPTETSLTDFEHLKITAPPLFSAAQMEHKYDEPDLSQDKKLQKAVPLNTIPPPPPPKIK